MFYIFVSDYKDILKALCKHVYNNQFYRFTRELLEAAISELWRLIFCLKPKRRSQRSDRKIYFSIWPL